MHPHSLPDNDVCPEQERICNTAKPLSVLDSTHNRKTWECSTHNRETWECSTHNRETWECSTHNRETRECSTHNRKTWECSTHNRETWECSTHNRKTWECSTYNRETWECSTHNRDTWEWLLCSMTFCLMLRHFLFEWFNSVNHYADNLYEEKDEVAVKTVLKRYKLSWLQGWPLLSGLVCLIRFYWKSTHFQPHESQSFLKSKEQAV